MKAFTLAEVLIVLGILGLIADMTIPTLHQNIDKKVTVTRLQKAYTTIAQAIRLSEAEYGSISDWDFGGSPSLENTRRFYGQYIKPYLNIAALCGEGSANGYVDKCGTAVSVDGQNYLLSDGTGFSIVASKSGASILIDINAGGKPNSMGRDAFYFTVKPDKGFTPYGYTKGMTREQIIDNEEFGGCKSKEPYQRHMCAALIMYDGWKISDDYPW